MLAPQVRGRLIVALVCIVGGGLLFVAEALPSDWRNQALTAINALLTWLAALDPRILYSVAGGVAVAGGIVIILYLTLHPRLKTYPPAIAPISIYFDNENQPIAVSQLPAFIAYIRSYIKGSRADLFFYADVNLPHNNRVYGVLRRAGFKEIEIFHKGVGKSKVQNAVDIELALHAYERALLTRAHQHIVLIAADRDYIPLLIRLRELGHDVSVWGRSLSPALKVIAEKIGVTVWEFGKQFADAIPAKPPAIAPSQTVTPASLEKPVLSEQQRQAGQERLQHAIALTLDIINTARQQITDDGALRALILARLAGQTGLVEAGFEGRHRATHWLTTMTALDAVRYSGDPPVLGAGEVDATRGAARFSQFLCELCDKVYALGRLSPTGSVALKKLGHVIRQRATQKQNPYQAIYRLAADRPGYLLIFLHSARALNLLDFAEEAANGVIRLRPEGPVPPPAVQPTPDAEQAAQ